MVTLKQQRLKKEIERMQGKRDEALSRMLKAADNYRKYDRTAKLLYNRLLKCRRDLRAAVAQVHDGQELPDERQLVRDRFNARKQLYAGSAM